MALIIPRNYKQRLLPETTEVAIKMVKERFQERLAHALDLRRVTAPLFVLSGTGINDDLNGVEQPVGFDITCMQGRHAEVVHSLAKWKRMKLAAYGIAPGYGLYTDMNAIRANEELDNLHSLYVDQWDWEKVITPQQRTLDYLYHTVRSIYEAIRQTEQLVYEEFPHITPRLPQDIHFVHSQELLDRYPNLSPKEREEQAARQWGAVFVTGIGAPLSNGEPHDGRAPDYDDWSHVNENGWDSTATSLCGTTSWKCLLNSHQWASASLPRRLRGNSTCEAAPSGLHCHSTVRCWPENCRCRLEAVSDRAGSACSCSKKHTSARCKPASGPKNRQDAAGNAASC